MAQNLTLPAPYSCGQIVYRAVIYENWIKNARVRPQAFTRLNKDVMGLSVGPTPEDSSRGFSLPIHGYLSLHVGHVRDIQLDVVPDTPTHANIIGVPFRDENEVEHGRLTRLLAAQARIL